MDNKIKCLIHLKAEEYGIPEQLLRAMVEVESSGNTYAMRYEPNYRWLYHAENMAKVVRVNEATEISQQKHSWGLLQVMGGVAREHGFRGKFMSELCDPEVGLGYGCKHLIRYYNKYNDWEKAIVSYNAGSPRKDDNGKYVNQYYLDKVLKHWSRA